MPWKEWIEVRFQTGLGLKVRDIPQFLNSLASGNDALLEGADLGKNIAPEVDMGNFLVVPMD